MQVRSGFERLETPRAQDRVGKQVPSHAVIAEVVANALENLAVDDIDEGEGRVALDELGEMSIER